ncbi:hypothetical protein HY570_01860 [Candidatus Micrarchaeota archaeon]|nr:hypothetical protein [Candidatus Micrarchaeota archaeon]
MELKNLMFGIAMFAILLGVAFADGDNETGNETIRGISLNGRYEHTVCKVNHAMLTLDSYITCANANNLSVGDLSDYRVKLQNDIVALRTATDAKDAEAFKAALKKVLDDMKDTAKAIRESLKDKGRERGAVLQCVKENSGDSASRLGQCERTALRRAKQETGDYYRNHTDKFERQSDRAKERGVSNAGSENTINIAKSLEKEIDKAVDSGDSQALYNLRLQFSRNAINFWIEQIDAALDYVKSKVEGSSSANKDQVLSEIASIETEVSSLRTSCAYSADVSDPVAYAAKNKECWDSLKNIEKELKDLRQLINSGRPQRTVNETEG